MSKLGPCENVFPPKKGHILLKLDSNGIKIVITGITQDLIGGTGKEDARVS